MEYRYLGQTGIKVSAVAFGGMALEPRAEGVADEATAFRMLDQFIAAGGNFIDTAVNYANGYSEAMLGRWMADRKLRGQIVLGTKVGFRAEDRGINDCGLTRKNLTHSIEQSLRRLQTDYIDLYQAHCPDRITPLEETMSVFGDLIRSGKVRYMGTSNWEAWRLGKAAGLAAHSTLPRPQNIQAQYHLLARDAEWDLLPLCRNEGIGVTIWSPLAAGWLSGKYHRGQMPPADSRLGHAVASLDEWEKIAQADNRASVPHPSAFKKRQEFREALNAGEAERRWAIIDAVREVATASGKSPAQTALAWLLAQEGVTAVVAGSRTPEQLEDNLGCVGWTIGEREMKWLDTVSDPGLPYPHGFLEQYVHTWR
jgi:aryl-alcohol dehydrogenase-like predicted oxidoreductase